MACIQLVPMSDKPSGDRDCKHEAGTFAPHVERGRCEGKADCVDVCPYDVFEVRRIADGDFEMLSVMERLRSRVHGRKTAYTPRADACRGCAACIKACPEDAITLVRVT
ncbi:MAG: Ferredoxin [Myxococcales bacterium]|nr:Ferredoxin [Myxococcales bacterium]